MVSDYQDKGLQAYVVIDRDAAGRLGVTVAAIDNALYNAFGQRLVSTIFTQSNQYRVVLEARSDAATGPGSHHRHLCAFVERLAGAALGGGTGGGTARACYRINRLEQFPAVTISFNLANGASLGEAVKMQSTPPNAKSVCRYRYRPAIRALHWHSVRRLPTSYAADSGSHRDDVHRARRAL